MASIKPDLKLPDGLESYVGTKSASGSYQSIINYIPPHQMYIEGCLGTGAILRNKLPADISICIDEDSKTIRKWDRWKKDPINNGMRNMFLLNKDVIVWLENCIILLQYIHEIGFPVFLYLDPPYPFEVRRSAKQKALYDHEFTEEDHASLLRVVNNLVFPVMISSYKNKKYDDRLKGWNTYSYPSMTRAGLATETIYMNYPEPEELHDYRYLGNNFRQRDKIGQKIKRQVSKWKNMKPQLRNAIIDQLKKSKHFI